MYSFSIDSMIRGYHQYKTIWENPSHHDELLCEREIGNAHDTHAVAIKKDIGGVQTTVGHIAKTISSICSIFLRRGGTILCEVNGHRRYSSDLPQGGLEVPCVLTFVATEEKEKAKTMRIFESVLGMKPKDSAECTTYTPIPDISGALTIQIPVQPVESDPFIDLTEQAQDTNQSPPNKKQKLFSEEQIIMGQDLSDIEINLAQELLKTQHPGLNGLRSTLFQERREVIAENNPVNNVQIVHCHERHHWITVTTVNCKPGEVKAFDSLFTYCDKETTRTIHNLFGTTNSPKPHITMGRCQKQKGEKDCGLFAIAFATAIASGLQPSKQNLDQSAMRIHLVHCFNQKQMSPFPCYQ